MRVVLVHDFLMQFGGAERVLQALASLFPDAPIYTLLFDEEIVRRHFPERDVRGSFLQAFPARVRARHRLLLPLYPWATEHLDVRDFDVVISSSSSFVKGVKKGAHATHICYCHAPARFIWEEHAQYLKDNHYGRFVRCIVQYMLAPFLRRWDLVSSRRVDVWVANSIATQQKIRQRYKKNAVVVYPPLTRFSHSNKQNTHPKEYFLIVSRLAAYKKIDVVIEAFNALGLPLVIVGKGPEQEYLERIAQKNIIFKRFIEDDALAECYHRATALIVACEEDFGMTPIEALSFGTPVLAYRRGGVMEWMEEGVTGEFFDAQTLQGVCDGVQKIMRNLVQYDPMHLQEIAHRFDMQGFRGAILRLLPLREGVDK